MVKKVDNKKGVIAAEVAVVKAAAPNAIKKEKKEKKEKKGEIGASKISRRFNKLRVKSGELDKKGVVYVGHLPKGFNEKEL